jgi:retron-type reverse transcriptase
MTVLPFATQIKNARAAIETDSPIKGEVIFCVQGVLSPLLSNLVLDDLDKELARRGHRFCRYADDCVPRTY